MPQVAVFYRELAPKLPAEVAAYDAKSSHVVRMEPFANHAQDVDASVKTVIITIGKPLDAGAGYSFNCGAGGQDHCLITGVFESDGLQVWLPVQLRSNQTYSFALTPAGFATQDGYPLQEYSVRSSAALWPGESKAFTAPTTFSR